jgi:2,3-bisphosphoglycerate-independent phosphoglycerate mutase
MKYIILLGDGMADYALPELGGKTPLEFAKTPNMDRIASEGTVGLIDTVPKGFIPGSDVANLSVMGYDPQKCYTGRGPLEAASLNITLDPEDTAFRCNLVTLSDEEEPAMEDFTAGHITSEEASKIIFDINEELGSSDITFYPGVSYRHLMVWKKGPLSSETTPPHDITGRKIDKYLPKGDGSETINRLMNLAGKILDNHPVNLSRLSQGKKPANAIWLWGEGRAPKMVTMTGKYNIRGGVISAVDLLHGIGLYAGLESIHVEGVTGYIDTNYEGKAKKALEYLKDNDFVFLHVESPDEMGHEGNTEGKIKAIEDFDKKVVGIVLEGIRKLGDFRVMVLSDHPTPVSIKTHSSDPSPFAIFSSIKDENLKNCTGFGETQAKGGHIFVSPGHLLMDGFMGDLRKFFDEKRS